MKVSKLTLDEALFTDNMEWRMPSSPELKGMYIPTYGKLDLVDDDFSIDDYITNSEAAASKVDNMSLIPEGPAEGVPTGVADMLMVAIKDEYEAIQEYNSIVSTINAESNSGNDFTYMIPVLQDILNEENKHVGQLQELLKRVSPNAKSSIEGEFEARAQLNPSIPSGNEWVNGKLKVQMHQPMMTNSTPTVTNEISDICSLSDVDDEM